MLWQILYNLKIFCPEGMGWDCDTYGGGG